MKLLILKDLRFNSFCYQSLSLDFLHVAFGMINWVRNRSTEWRDFWTGTRRDYWVPWVSETSSVLTLTSCVLEYKAMIEKKIHFRWPPKDTRQAEDRADAWKHGAVLRTHYTLLPFSLYWPTVGAVSSEGVGQAKPRKNSFSNHVTGIQPLQRRQNSVKLTGYSCASSGKAGWHPR